MTFLTKMEVETRLEALRQQRDAIERDIADCLAFLELGRRLEKTKAPDASNHEIRLRPAATAHRPDVGEGFTISDTRQHGRAIIAACIAILQSANRPMHVSELLSALLADGFKIAGADPVASLNTRLWKRSTDKGPFRRLGDAVYDLAPGTNISSADPIGSRDDPNR